MLRLVWIGTRGDRRWIVVVAFSAAMLAVTVSVRMITPSALAPRVHIRWTGGLTDAERARFEREFVLLEGARREGTTWEYDLAEPSPVVLGKLLASPAVADSHYINRGTGEVDSNAPRGTTSLAQTGWWVRLVHSALFDWFISFWVSASIISGVQAASSSNQLRR